MSIEIKGPRQTSGLIKALALRVAAFYCQLSESTQRLRAGDFSARTGLKGSGELYQLAQRFDEMADELQRNRRAAEEANREVAVINAKLEAKNLELQARTIELERNRQELQLILDSAPALMFVKDRAHRHVRVNKALLDFHGLSREAAGSGSLLPRR